MPSFFPAVRKKGAKPPAPWADDLADLRLFKRTGDLAARNRVVQRNDRLATLMAHWAHKRNLSVELEDLKQAARIGLIVAASRFDPERGVKFTTAAVPWVRALVQQAVRTIKQSMTGGAPLWHEASPVDSIEGLRSTRTDPSHETTDELLGRLTEPVEPDPTRDEDSRRLVALAAAALSDPLERAVFHLRVMRDPDEQETLQDLGLKFGRSREYIRQVELRVKRKCKRALERVQEEVE